MSKEDRKEKRREKFYEKDVALLPTPEEFKKILEDTREERTKRFAEMVAISDKFFEENPDVPEVSGGMPMDELEDYLAAEELEHEEFDTILDLISMKSGFVVSYEGISVYKLTNGKYAVTEGTYSTGVKEKQFDNDLEAVRYFWGKIGRE